MRVKVEFESNGIALSGALETPESEPRCYAMFAHCFTCGKDVAAASRIARAMTAAGIAVLRFDFTGLGNSDGDFANTNFSSNLEDLLAAAAYLRENYEAPKLLVGHSLGGAAVLAMAAAVPEATAVVTLGSPFQADHVMHLFSDSLAEIRATGEATVRLGARTFNIKRQFVEDLVGQPVESLNRLKKALLVMHSPLDDIVPIAEAEKIFTAARHPKSFVSLDGADHLLSRKEDSEYVAATIAGWASRYLPKPEYQTGKGAERGHVRVAEKDHVFTQDVYTDNHHWLADEPVSVGGKDRGPDPYEHLLAALGTCTAMTLRLYARHKGLSLDHVEVGLRHSRDYFKDCQGCAEEGAKIEVLERIVSLRGDLTDEQRTRLLEIADRCPVHRTLHGELQVKTVPGSQG